MADNPPIDHEQPFGEPDFTKPPKRVLQSWDYEAEIREALKPTDAPKEFRHHINRFSEELWNTAENFWGRRARTLEDFVSRKEIEIKDEWEKFQQEFAKYDEKIERYEIDIQRYNAEIKRYHKESHTYVAKIHHLEQKIHLQSLNETKLKKEGSLAAKKLEAENSLLRRKLGQTEQQKGQKSHEIERMKMAYRKLQKKLITAEERNNHLETELKFKRNESNQLKAHLKHEQERAAHAEKQNRQLEDVRNQMLTQRAKLQAALDLPNLANPGPDQDVPHSASRSTTTPPPAARPSPKSTRSKKTPANSRPLLQKQYNLII